MQPGLSLWPAATDRSNSIDRMRLRALERLKIIGSFAFQDGASIAIEGPGCWKWLRHIEP
jgi:hypothetical protein